MNRRDFILLSGAAAILASNLPYTALAQQSTRIRKIGILVAGTENKGGPSQIELTTARDSLANLGWIEDRNIELIVRWAGADDEGFRRGAAAELVRQAPDAILTFTAPVTLALMRATVTIPIVFASGGDPVVTGIVSNLARPGGNVTGFSATEPSLAGKWFNLLSEIAPNARRVAIIDPPENPVLSAYHRTIESAAGGRLELVSIEAREDAQIEREIEAFARVPQGMLLVLPGASAGAHQDAIINAAAKHRLPAIYPFRIFVTAGGLMSYGADSIELVRSAVGYLDRILRGEKAGDLPVQMPARFEFVINMKTAKALGLTVPNTLLVSATEVIE